MNTLQAYLFDGQSSARRTVVVKLTVPGYLVLQELGTLSRFQLEDVEIAPQLGDQPARISLPDGSHLEVPDGPEFFRQLEGAGGRRQWAHRLESSWSWVMLAVAITTLLGWLAYDKGIPAAARMVAYQLPEEFDERIGSEGLEALDNSALQPSDLPIPRQYELRVVFAEVISAVGQPERNSYDLVFRHGGRFGANALALPDGTIVLTDELVALAEQDAEIAAVLAHEIGHVRNRHAMRTLLQNSVVAGLVIWLTGDVSAATSMAAGIPTVLAQAGYSRQFEYEADTVARKYLEITAQPLHTYTDLLERLEESRPGDAPLNGLLATHPDTRERIEAFKR